MNVGQFIEKNAPKNRVALLVVLDLLIVSVTGFLALYVRYDFRFSRMDMQYVSAELKYLPVNLVLTIILFVLFRLYRSVWSFASSTELLNVISACTVSIVLQGIILAVMRVRMPISFYLIKYFLLIMGVGALRFTYRILRMFQERRPGFKEDARRNTMVVGAGEAGAMVIKEFQNSRYLDQKVCCVVDDNESKQGKYLRGVKIMGTRNDIGFLARELNVDEIIVALPSVPQSEVREILQICQETGCKLRVLPGIYQMINGEVSVSRLRKVEIEDLLGRAPIKLQVESVMGYVEIGRAHV